MKYKERKGNKIAVFLLSMCLVFKTLFRNFCRVKNGIFGHKMALALIGRLARSFHKQSHPVTKAIK